MNGLRHAFKEWAVICRALAQGRQSLLLRKGGIDEAAGGFQVEHERFWLFPTFLHQQQDGITAEAQPLLDEALADRPPKDRVRLSHFAKVECIYWLQEVAAALRLGDLHCWSSATVQARFVYRRPGLYVLPVRVFQVPQPIEIPLTAEYAGCKSWVELSQELSTEGAVPVLSDEAFTELLRTLDRRLEPTALA